MSTESISCLAKNLFKYKIGCREFNNYLEEKDISSAEELYKVLMWENMRSLNARYDDKHKKKDIQEYIFNTEDLNFPEIYKKLNCWIYQSCETKSFFNTKLYKVISKMSDYFAHKYIRDSEAYDKAKWD